MKKSDEPMVPTYSMRQAASDDIERILALYVQAGIGPLQTYTPSEGRQAFAALARYPFYRVYVAQDGAQSRVVGTYALCVLDNLAKRGAKSAIMEDVAVDPIEQGRGVGRAMVTHALATAREQGAYKLALSSNLARGDAHAFYQAMGFEQHGLSFRVDL